MVINHTLNITKSPMLQKTFDDHPDIRVVVSYVWWDGDIIEDFETDEISYHDDEGLLCWFEGELLAEVTRLLTDDQKFQDALYAEAEQDAQEREVERKADALEAAQLSRWLAKHGN